MNNTNRYDPMPADYGDDGEVKALVGAGKAPESEPVKEEKTVKAATPEEEELLEKAAASPSVKRGRPAKKVAHKAEDEQGTTAKN